MVEEGLRSKIKQIRLFVEELNVYKKVDPDSYGVHKSMSDFVRINNIDKNATEIKIMVMMKKEEF